MKDASVSTSLIRRRQTPDASLSELPGELHPVLRRVYAARHVGPDQLRPSLADLIPVGRLAGAAPAARRLIDARDRGERILVLGDFDADGATATALCVSCMRALGFPDVVYVVPNRIEFGYGLSPAIADHAATLSPDLILTVDNGVSSVDGVRRARELGIEVVVTDHHLPGTELPDAACIVNPNLPDEPFPSKCLAGVGVAFYLMASISRTLVESGALDANTGRSAVADALDLVALGTVADLVPLDFNNRILVSEGLARMRAGRTRPGIRALFDVAGRNLASARSSDLAFAIAPRLNAAGRLTDMKTGIECLLADDSGAARALAAQLDKINVERRELQARMEAEARRHVDALRVGLDDEHADAYCLFDAGWHEGVVGLVASRVKDQVNRPIVAFANADERGMLKGSARSVEGIHIRDVIDAVAAHHPGLVPKFGGHAMAAGLSLRAADLERFRTAFETEVSRFAGVLAEPGEIWTDGVLTADDTQIELAEELSGAGPWGQGFPEPLFENRLELVDCKLLKDRHLKLRVCHPGDSRILDAIAFNQAELPELGPDASLRLVYRLDVNEFRNRRTAQLVVEHMQSD
ncbi:MAG: single-stranded-DNA-specific exonuclease RecJ [Gammaproteobacteria bacterium]|nr:single-stranded-DNA-specific exonuclease RecJ [Gammaproteobacteria bacterium]